MSYILQIARAPGDTSRNSVYLPWVAEIQQIIDVTQILYVRTPKNQRLRPSRAAVDEKRHHSDAIFHADRDKGSD